MYAGFYFEGHEDEMLVQPFAHVVMVPTDPQSGNPSGQRVHTPFQFTVSLNKAVPLMYNALASGEKLKNVELKWYRTSIEGKQENFFTTKLKKHRLLTSNVKYHIAKTQQTLISHKT